MINQKKTISLLVKLIIGLISFYIIYSRLKSIPHFKEQCFFWFSEPKFYSILLLVLGLMLVNWGIETYKWKLITQQIQQVPYSLALKSIFSGICVGNIAPGRALEFLAKIAFFKPENRASITVLHFINGMFQMLITVAAGLISIVYKLKQSQQSTAIIYGALAAGILMILFFCWAIFNAHYIHQKLKFFKWFKAFGDNQIGFTKSLILKLISLSIIRYAVFTTQFYLIYNALMPQNDMISIFVSIASYFMLTSLVPMISVIEPAIRAAIALFVFNGSGDQTVIIVLSSTFVWIINVVIPSAIGYIIILKEKIDFKSVSVN